MILVAQRVVRPSDRATGFNAYCYLHPNRQWLDEPPPDLGRGTLVGRLTEVPPPGNRIRSFLDITTPDTTSDDEIVQVVSSGAALMFDTGRELPWNLRNSETRFRFDLELSLAEQWELELRILLGYALQVRAVRA